MRKVVLPRDADFEIEEVLTGNEVAKLSRIMRTNLRTLGENCDMDSIGVQAQSECSADLEPGKRFAFIRKGRDTLGFLPSTLQITQEVRGWVVRTISGTYRIIFEEKN